MIADKIKSRAELGDLCRQFHLHSRKIGFTSGAFDIIHAGHVDYLEKAKKQCDLLIVGINSDRSIRKYKGGDRPIISEQQRLKTIAALESVDYVFLFDERRNEKNISTLQPDFYFKAGDYSAAQLTSGPVIERLGGKVVLIPVTEDVSTTAIIDKIITAYGAIEAYVEEEPGMGYFERLQLKKTPAVFLDRDGTINKQIDFLSDPEKFEFLPGALAGMKKMKDMGYHLVIITNQQGIGLGYYTKEDFYRVNRVLLIAASQAGITIDKIYFCPHSLAENCNCRKPAIGLVKRAEQELNLDLAHSYFIGDSIVDIEAGQRAGMKTILIQEGTAATADTDQVRLDFVAHNLLDAADIILAEERK